jgi:hypothetical protein
MRVYNKRSCRFTAIPIDTSGTIHMYPKHRCTLTPTENKSVKQSQMLDLVNAKYIEPHITRQDRVTGSPWTDSTGNHAPKQHAQRNINVSCSQSSYQLRVEAALELPFTYAVRALR